MNDYYKLAVVGAVGAGKTEMISTISDISPVRTEARSTVDIGKEFTTVGIDYGRLMLEGDKALGVYGVPGQERYSFVWDMVNQSLWGIVALLRLDQSGSVSELETVLRHFNPNATGVACVVGITHAEEASSAELNLAMTDAKALLSSTNIDAPILSVDARSRASVMPVLQMLNAMNHYARQAREA